MLEASECIRSLRLALRQMPQRSNMKDCVGRRMQHVRGLSNLIAKLKAQGSDVKLELFARLLSWKLTQLECFCHVWALRIKKRPGSVDLGSRIGLSSPGSSDGDEKATVSEWMLQ